MDYTEVRNNTITMGTLQGINPASFDTEDTLYFDETGNIKKFRLKSDSFNNSSETHFVLGGVEAKTKITFEDLKKIFHLQNNATEVKSTKIFKGDFGDILNHRFLNNFLKLIDEKDWHIHYTAVNLLYYSLVDLIDSFFKGSVEELAMAKAILYNVMKRDITSTTSLLYKYNYPDLKDEDVPRFCDDIFLLFIQQYPSKDFKYPNLLERIIETLTEARNTSNPQKKIFTYFP